MSDTTPRQSGPVLNGTPAAQKSAQKSAQNGALNGGPSGTGPVLKAAPASSSSGPVLSGSPALPPSGPILSGVPAHGKTGRGKMLAAAALAGLGALAALHYCSRQDAPQEAKPVPLSNDFVLASNGAPFLKNPASRSVRLATFNSGACLHLATDFFMERTRNGFLRVVAWEKGKGPVFGYVAASDVRRAPATMTETACKASMRPA
ncbi:MAG: hypothetical protein WC989_04500 [Micavibrio sp.]